MVNKELIEWIKSQESKGYTAEQLKDYLLKQSYSESDIIEAIKYTNQNKSNNIQQINDISFMNKLKLFFSNPKELIKNIKPKSSVGKGILNYVILTEILLIMQGIIAFIFLPDIPGLSFLKKLGIFLFIAGIFVFPLMVIVWSFIFSGVLYLLMKIFKGIGEFKELYYLVAIIIFPVFIFLSIISSLINNFVMIILMLFFFVIVLFFLTLILKEVGQFKTSKAVLCWAIPLIVIAIFFFMLFFSVSRLTGFQPLGTNIQGFEVLSPQKNSLMISNEIDKSYFTLGFINMNNELIFNTTTLTITKNNNICVINHLNIFGFVQQNLKENPIITIPKQSPFFLKGEISGPGCGGIKGEEYLYYISMKIEKESQILDNSGTISGKYTDPNFGY